MLNSYPLWKYIILVFILIFGLLYALPNFFGEDFAIQITGTSGTTISKLTLRYINNLLQKQHITNKSITLINDTILVKFNNQNIQLSAYETLLNTLGNNYVVALHLAPATPLFLAKIGSKPMKLGLDLRGGVHFLIDVDINTILSNVQQKNISMMLEELRAKNIPYISVHKIDNYGSEICFLNASIREQALYLIRSINHTNLLIKRSGKYNISANLSDTNIREVRNSAVQQNMTIIRNRVNQLGIAESLVQRNGSNRIIVELPGIQDPARAKEIIGATAMLEFRLVNNNTVYNPNEASKRFPENLEVKFTRHGHPVVLYKPIIMTGNHIINATCSKDDYNNPQVNIFLDHAGGNIMSKFTKNNIGKLIATLLIEYKDHGKNNTNLVKQEEVINIATIQSRISNMFCITGISNMKEARHLALLLRTGALSAPIKIVEECTIGPTLGRLNITQGLVACIWGLIASILFMVIWYRKFGLIAATALIANCILIMGVMSLLPGATLTMPGIAGIVLTLAVAVDANVLIYERIKEELLNGRKVQHAIHQGYHCAFSSILDANMTTLITTIILYEFGTGPIKGFAITTAIGIATSMFTAIIGTRAIVNLLYGSKSISKLSI
ncbi:protein translocase subunit SecD [Candidatus Palibaumannia cicadellinicola]|uniref:protein translocase subunit SecD n=1 Tax=Candidatus Palibaumannia cicadellinicola TaxID=186490 RepID=UPI00069F1C92|nr:protein translocase subunit SecD [Candidatus Baumannia cicadellinicola]